MHRFLARPESAADIEANVRRFTDLGVHVWFTEVDVAIALPADPTELAEQAQRLRRRLRSVPAGTALRRCDHRGASDRYSWIPGAFPGFGAALPYDEQLHPKPAYDAIVATLRARPTAGRRSGPWIRRGEADGSGPSDVDTRVRFPGASGP